MIKRYSQFLLEKRDLESREKISASNRIYSFLKKHNFNYEGAGSDSLLFASFKTGDFETIIPPKALGGNQYKSPQGFYCYDMNFFKKRMFGDSEISPENYNSGNLLMGSDEALKDLGLGYANHDTSVDPDSIWKGLPRYLYLVKAKEGSLILSRNSNSLKFYNPIEKLLKGYSHLFLKSSDVKDFSKKYKTDSGLEKKTYEELVKYFKENSEEYKKNFIRYLLELFSVMKSDKNIHIAMYEFILYGCAFTLKENNSYVRFTLICNAIGIDGFTQRNGENSYIHPSPVYQTLILSEGCVQDLIKIDLKKEGRTDDYVSNKKADMNQEEFFKNLKPGDCLFNRDNQKYTEFIDSESFLTTIKGVKRWKQDIADYTKIDLTKNKAWSLIDKLKVGDWIKISTTPFEESGIKCRTVIINILELAGSGTDIDLKFREKLFTETITSTKSIRYNIGGEDKNPRFEYSLKRLDKNMPLFDSQSINPPIYKFWIDNRAELEKQGAKWETFIDEYDRAEIVESVEDIFTNPKWQRSDFNLPTYCYPKNEFGLLNVLSLFEKRLSDRLFGSQGSYKKDNMTMYLYRGDLEKPIKVFMSSFGLD